MVRLVHLYIQETDRFRMTALLYSQILLITFITITDSQTTVNINTKCMSINDNSTHICYWITSSRQNITKSEEKCRKNGGQLALIRNENASNVVRDVIIQSLNLTRIIFIGYTITPSGSVVEYGTTNRQNWTYWRKDQPDKKKICVTVRKWNAMWQSAYCTKSRNAVCYNITTALNRETTVEIPVTSTSLTSSAASTYSETTMGETSTCSDISLEATSMITPTYISTETEAQDLTELSPHKMKNKEGTGSSFPYAILGGVLGGFVVLVTVCLLLLFLLRRRRVKYEEQSEKIGEQPKSRKTDKRGTTRLNNDTHTDGESPLHNSVDNKSYELIHSPDKKLSLNSNGNKKLPKADNRESVQTGDSHYEVANRKQAYQGLENNISTAACKTGDRLPTESPGDQDNYFVLEKETANETNKVDDYFILEPSSRNHCSSSQMDTFKNDDMYSKLNEKEDISVRETTYSNMKNMCGSNSDSDTYDHLGTKMHKDKCLDDEYDHVVPDTVNDPDGYSTFTNITSREDNNDYDKL